MRLTLALLLAASPVHAAVAARVPALRTTPVSVPLAAPALSVRSLSASPVAAPRIAAPITAAASVSAAASASLAAPAPKDGAPGEASYGYADQEFRRLTGERAFERLPRYELASLHSLHQAESAPASRLEKPDAPEEDLEKKANVSRMMRASMAMKVGIESTKVSVPLLALSALGGPAGLAVLTVVDNVAQALMAGVTAQLTRKFSPEKVLGGAIAVQAVLVAGVFGLFIAGMASLWTLVPMYAAIGSIVGVAETARRSLPARLLGRDGDALEKYNAKLHIRYEIAGVAAAFAVGLLLSKVGPHWTLLIHPPLFALAAWWFLKVKTPAQAAPPPDAEAPKGGLKGYWSDIKAGFAILWRNPLLRIASLAYIIPHMGHRIFENMVLPVFAKKVLEENSYAGYFAAASNAGELIGAALLLRYSARLPGSAKWVALSAFALAAAWAFVFLPHMAALIPAIVIIAGGWAASDLKLMSRIQELVSRKDQERVMAPIYAGIVALTAAVSLSLGWFLGAVPLALGFTVVAALFTALGAWVWWASRKIAAGEAKKPA